MENKCAESFSMTGGEGLHSYAQNSVFQRNIIEEAKSLMQSAIADKLDIKALCASSSTNPICIADLGCSTGPNTFIAVQNLIEAIQLQLQSHNYQSTPEFLVLFNDQVSNDFNTLFQNLPPNKNYFAAAIPGSFYGRLFPKQSLQFVHISSALTWLSKLPKELTDKTSGAWNEGRIHYTNAPTEVEDAYKSQFVMDLETFLHARAQELVGNGLIVIAMQAAHDLTDDFSGDLDAEKDIELLESCLMDMATLGLVSEEKVNTFNLPVYFPRVKDLKKILESNKSFSLERMVIMDQNCLSIPMETYVSTARAVLEVLIEKHFGNGIDVDELFYRYKEKMKEFPEIFSDPKWYRHQLFILLKRNVHA